MPKIIIFDNKNYGAPYTLLTVVTPDLGAMDKITSSAIVCFGVWNLYSETQYQGTAWTLSDSAGPALNGTYPDYPDFFQNDTFQSARPSPSCQTMDPSQMILLFDNTNFGGISTRLEDSCTDLRQYPIGYTTSALIVGKGSWNLYTRINYEGNVYTVSSTGGPKGDGLYPTYQGFFPNDTIGSISPAA